MDKTELPDPTMVGKDVDTACGSLVTLGENTPWITYREEVVFFCQASCKLQYEKDPKNSCLTGRILAGN